MLLSFHKVKYLVVVTQEVQSGSHKSACVTKEVLRVRTLRVAVARESISKCNTYLLYAFRHDHIVMAKRLHPLLLNTNLCNYANPCKHIFKKKSCFANHGYIKVLLYSVQQSIRNLGRRSPRNATMTNLLPILNCYSRER